jgi:GNAT superfamily N-acetyltransferase
MLAARNGSPKAGCAPHPDWLYLARPRCLRAPMIETTKTIDRMLRRLELDDMDAAARVLRTTFDRALPWLAGLHTPEEDRWFFRERVFKACEVWGAFDSAGLTGVLAFRDGWIDQLYVLPKAWGRGVGTELRRLPRRNPPTARAGALVTAKSGGLWIKPV